MAFAVILATGLDGIRQRMPLPAASEESLYLLNNAPATYRSLMPCSLEDALENLQQNQVVREALSLYVFECFIHAKRAEWADYSLEVTTWELNTY